MVNFISFYFISAISDSMIFHPNICIRNMIIPNIPCLKFHVCFYFRLPESEISK